MSLPANSIWRRQWPFFGRRSRLNFARQPFPCNQLELEITESAIMQDVDYALRELQQLRELG